MTPEEYLDRPYHFILVYDSESETWTGTVKEFPGCIAQDNAIMILESLWWAARDWIAAALDLGQEIPEPEMTASPMGGCTDDEQIPLPDG
jgi:predicted RNase H-like HicB family nuclease